MKICLLGFNLTGKRKEGVRNIVYNLAKELQKSDIDVFIITNGEESATIEAEGIRIRQIASPSSVYGFIFKVKSFANEFRKVLNEEKPDIIHDHFVTSGSSLMITLPSMKYFKKKNVKYVKSIYNKSLSLLNMHSILKPFNLKYFILDGGMRIVFNNILLDKFIAKHFDYFLYHSNSIGKQFNISQSIIPNSKVNMGIPNKFITEDKNTSTIPYTVSYLGHPSFKKGVSLFLEASKILLSTDSKIKISLALSKTAEGESTYTKIVKELQNQFPDRVTLLGEIDPKDIYTSSSLMVYPLLHDWAAISPPLSLLEGMGSGAVVLTSTVCGMEEIVFNKKNGYTFKGSNPKILAEKIEGILNTDKNKLLEISKNSRKTAEKHSWNTVIKEYIKIYKQLITDYENK